MKTASCNGLLPFECIGSDHGTRENNFIPTSNGIAMERLPYMQTGILKNIDTTMIDKWIN